MYKIKSLIAALALTAVSAASQASVISFSTNAYTNSTGGGSGANSLAGIVNVTLGELLEFNTSTTQLWSGATSGDSNYSVLHTNASGTTAYGWNIYLNGTTVPVGTLVGEIGGVYRTIGAGDVTLASWGVGALHLWYADSNYRDNAGTVNTTLTITAVPEPGSLALLGLGLVGLAGLRRRAK